MKILDEKVLINAIYRATEGEGINIGTPQIFVRFQGCSIRCKNCDSKETWDFNPCNQMRLSSVVSEIYKEAGDYPNQIKRVSITGGDPLDPQHIEGVRALVKILKHDGFTINLEAAGSVIDHQIFDSIDFISFDFKSPSTGNSDNNIDNIIELAKQYAGKFQIKTVNADKIDFFATLNARNQIKRQLNLENISANFPWCITPAYNTEEAFPAERFTLIQKLNEEAGAPFRIIGQQHKWIYGSDCKLV